MAEKNVFVTGGSRGLGRGIALEFARAGYGVAFTYVSRVDAADETLAALKEINPAGKFRHWKLDVGDSSQVEAVVDAAVELFDELPVVVNNAGENSNNAAALMGDEQWHRVIATCLSGPFFVARQFLMHMLSMRFGRIINIGSLSADGTTGQANYSAAKAGLQGLSRSIAKEYGPKGITCNVVVPGTFRTDMVEQTMSKDLREFWLKFCPTRRFGEMPELTKLILLLASEDGAFINGECIQITGGLNYSP
ncbi:MAG: SDR family NAD(P)-dependent oxidoreductase [Planctomycetota bacterium]